MIENEKHNLKELYTLPDLQHGLIQSPVNILTSTLEDGATHKIEVHNTHPEKATAVVNTGHTIQLEFEPGSTIDFDGNTFEFQQAHFHTPSEHQVDGMTFPMEMHFVNTLQDMNNDQPAYLVIALFFKMGEENVFIKNFIDLIPTHEHDTVSLRGASVFIDDLVGDVTPDRNYYYYKGSLTTPPFTESVNWLVLRTILEASPEQIRIINEIEGNNARHVQARYGRKLESD